VVALLVADDGVELDDGLLLLRAEGPALDVRPKVVGPPQPAALAAAVQPCNRRKRKRLDEIMQDEEEPSIIDDEIPRCAS
jgi:hypothetical protein